MMKRINTPYSNNIISKESKKFDQQEPVNFSMPLLGRNIILEGTIVKIGQRIRCNSAILVECEKCGSIFYFILDTLNQFLPFLCNKSNCTSKNFFSHFSRFISEKFQIIKLGKISINYRKLQISETLIYKLFGDIKVPLFKGLKIFSEALLKLKPVSKTKFSTLGQRVFYEIYLEGQNCKNSSIYHFNYKNKFFLSQKDFSFLCQANIYLNVFHIFIKNTLPVGGENEGIKACLLLLFSQQINNFRGQFEQPHLNFCCIVSDTHGRDNLFLEELAKSFPKSFFFNFENFKNKFSRGLKNHSSFFKSDNNKFENCMIFINLEIKISKKTQIISIIDNIGKIIKNNQKIFTKSLIVFHIKSEKKKEFEKEYFNIVNKPSKFFNLVYFLKEKAFKSLEKKKMFPISNQQTCKKFGASKPVETENSLNTTSAFNSLVNKKKISRLFFKKYLNFIRTFSDAKLTTKSYNILIQIYKKLKFVKIGLFTFPSNFLLTIQKLSQCRAKIDLRGRVDIEDVFDGMEIFFDSKPKFFNIIIQSLKVNTRKTYKKVNSIFRFLRLLHKFFYRSGQTIFEKKVFENILYHDFYFSEIICILKTFKIVKILRNDLLLLNV